MSVNVFSRFPVSGVRNVLSIKRIALRNFSVSVNSEKGIDSWCNAKTKYSKISRVCYCNSLTPKLWESCSNRLLHQKVKHRGYVNEIKISRKVDTDYAWETIHNALKSLSLKQSYCSDDWEKLKELVLRNGTALNANKTNVETVIMKKLIPFENLILGRSYYLHLKGLNKCINIVTSGWYLRLNYNCLNDLTEDDVLLVNSICDEIMAKLPFIDISILESLILGLCVTDRWKDSFKVIEKLRGVHDSLPNPCYNAIVIAAFKHGDYPTGWQLMEKRVKDGWNPNEQIFSVWLDVCDNKIVAVNRLLNFLAEHSVLPSDNFATNLLSCVKNLNIKHNEILPSTTSITQKGICKHCKNKLNDAALTHEEFETLRSSFLDPLIIGKNIFLKSTPEELDQFTELLKQTAPYDFVLDGLNIAYAVGIKKQRSEMFSNKLKTVVEYLTSQQKKVLVLGRKHMKHWPKKDVDYIMKHATLFLADDVSKDDPYLLYATIYSGINCKFISRDMMRGHKYLLGLFDSKLYALFWRWQCQSQYFLVYIENNGNVVLKPPVTYVQMPHQLENGSRRWHIPCTSILEPNTPGHKKFTLQSWLCIPSIDSV